MRKITLGLLMLGVAACSSSSTSHKGQQDAGPADSGAPDSAIPDANLGQDGSSNDDGGTLDSGPAAPDLLGVDLAPTPQPSPSAGCGNGTREAGEQCDDGNNINLDGCDADCKFEQVQRFTSLALETAPQTGAGAVCTKDAIGVALKNLASTLNGTITTDIGNGTISLLIPFSPLSDLTGQSSTAQVIQLGALSSVTDPSPAPVGYSGASDLDYWYRPDPAALSAQREPSQEFTATLQSGKLTAGPATIPVSLGLLSADLFNASISATVGTPNAPKAAVGTAPPGHLASEHLDPALTSFQSLTAGSLCGDVRAADLAAAQIGTQTGALLGFICPDQSFSATSSVLDLLVAGCTSTTTGSGGKKTVTTTIPPTQPDGPAGTTYTFTLTDSKVTGCTGGKGTLSACLAAATYSTYFNFTADRVIPRK